MEIQDDSMEDLNLLLDFIHIQTKCCDNTTFNTCKYIILLAFFVDTIELPESKEWDVYVCYICSPTDVTIRLVGAGHSVSEKCIFF